MSDLRKILAKHYSERYELWLKTRDAKYLNQDGLTDKEAEKIREEVYNSVYKIGKNKKGR